MSTAKAFTPAPITFGLGQWTEITGLPVTTANEMVALGLIRSLKVGRRRLFIHADVQKMFERLAARGKNLEPRKLYLAKRAKAARP